MNEQIEQNIIENRTEHDTLLRKLHQMGIYGLLRHCCNKQDKTLNNPRNSVSCPPGKGTFGYTSYSLQSSHKGSGTNCHSFGCAACSTGGKWTWTPSSLQSSKYRSKSGCVLSTPGIACRCQSGRSGRASGRSTESTHHPLPPHEPSYLSAKPWLRTSSTSHRCFPSPP